MECLTCQEKTTNPKFCSRSCAVKHNNQTPKRKITRKCSKCDLPAKNYRTRLCIIHYNEYKDSLNESYKTKTIEEYQNKESVKNKHPSWKNAHIRLLGRAWHKDLLTKPCAHCGYDKHVELCHIKPIKDFPLTTTIGEINDSSNVIQLCPNCHWEMDNLRGQ